MADERKFALPNSQQFRAFYAQKRRRSRNSNVVVPVIRYYLKFDGGRINFPSDPLTEYRLVFDIQVNQGATGVWLSQDNNISNYITFSSNSVSLKPEGKSAKTFTQGSSAIPLFDNRVTLDIDVKVAGTTIVITEPLSSKTLTSNLDLTGFDFTQMFKRGDTGQTIFGELYGLSVYDGAGLLINKYDMTGDGTTVIDTVSGRNATLTGAYTWEVLPATPATQPNLTFPLIAQTALPNGAQGQNPSGGFTNTGLDWIPPNAQYASGAWLVGNDGRATTTSSPNLSSLVILSADFTTILDEWDMSGATFANGKTIQGVAVADDGSYYAASGAGTGLILHIDSADGTKLGEISATAVNGLAFDSQRNGLWWRSGNDSVVNFYDLTTLANTDKFGVVSSIDMIGITADGYLYGSYGTNGVDGKVRFYDTVSKAAFADTIGLVNCQAIEGVYYDSSTKVLSVMNDGGFHSEASPSLSLGITYDASSMSLKPVQG